jgi:hypothetical protein
LINATLNTGGELPLLERLTTLMEELRSTFAALSTAEGRPISGCLPPATISVGPPAAGRTLEETARSRQEPREFAVKREQTQAASQNLKEQSDTIFWVSHENILVQRERYEAMLYELGKLGAWHEVQKLYFRENKSLREKLESQQQKEVLHLRRLCSQKKGKGWWR